MFTDELTGSVDQDAVNIFKPRFTLLVKIMKIPYSQCQQFTPYVFLMRRLCGTTARKRREKFRGKR